MKWTILIAAANSAANVVFGWIPVAFVRFKMRTGKQDLYVLIDRFKTTATTITMKKITNKKKTRFKMSISDTHNYKYSYQDILTPTKLN